MLHQTLLIYTSFFFLPHNSGRSQVTGINLSLLSKTTTTKMLRSDPLKVGLKKRFHRLSDRKKLPINICSLFFCHFAHLKMFFRNVITFLFFFISLDWLESEVATLVCRLFVTVLVSF